MIDRTYIGYPCTFGPKGAVGRIVAHGKDSAYIETEEGTLNAVVLWCTPHGSILKTGIAHLHPMNEEQGIILSKYEEDVSKHHGEPYYTDAVKKFIKEKGSPIKQLNDAVII